jgi:hypothetical protein
MFAIKVKNIIDFFGVASLLPLPWRVWVASIVMSTNMYFRLFNTMTRSYLSTMQMMVAASETVSHRSALHHQGSAGQIPYPHAEMLGMVSEKVENLWSTGMIAMGEWQKMAAKNMLRSNPTFPSALSTMHSLERIVAPTRRKVLANARRLKKKK